MTVKLPQVLVVVDHLALSEVLVVGPGELALLVVKCSELSHRMIIIRIDAFSFRQEELHHQLQLGVQFSLHHV